MDLKLLSNAFLVLFILTLNRGFATQEIKNCNFLDTVNITDSQKFSNGSYLYENVVIPPELTGTYDYDLVQGLKRVPVPAHIRGCVCKLKSCVKFCCHPSEIKLNDSMNCSQELGTELKYSPMIDVTLNNGSRQMVHVLDDFVVQQSIPCSDGYHLLPQLDNDSSWQLFEFRNFLDTVNITDSQKFSNGSYLYENVVIPPELTGTYDYDLVQGLKRVPVPAHIRGCVCKLKSCVKFCCHPSEIKLNDSMNCSQELGTELKYSPMIDVTLNNGSRQMVHVLDDFVVQQSIPCSDGYHLLPQLDNDSSWQLFENGTLLRMYDNAFLDKSEYCLTPSKVDGNYYLNPINCPFYKEKSTNELVNAITMLISIPFLVLTIFVYVAIPELHNLHGKCLISYLVALALGYTMMVTISFEDKEDEFTKIECSLFGFIGYYCFLAAFFWVSVISFDLWHNFHAAQGAGNRFLRRKRFAVYSMYAWGLPVIFTILTIIAQFSELDDTLKPGFGLYRCWLSIEFWSPMIYFYGPFLILMLFNLTMFILTAIKIHRVQKDLARIVAQEESTKHFSTQKDNFGLFLRLFIVMGITWLLEVFSYMVGMENIWSTFFYIPDFCNAAQGVIIFVLFVLKRKVKILIMKSLLRRETASSRSSSTHSELAPEEMSLQDNPKNGVVSFLE